MTEENLNQQAENETPEVELSEEDKALAMIDSLTAERDEWKDKAMRLAAEMENLRKRTRKEIEDVRKFSVANFAKEVLSIKDNLERAEDAMKAELAKDTPSIESLVEGVKMVLDGVDSVFAKAKITRVKSVGEKFNPDHHQVMMEIPTDEHEAGTVVQEMQAGYLLEDRLLRPAMVGTAKKA